MGAAVTVSKSCHGSPGEISRTGRESGPPESGQTWRGDTREAASQLKPQRERGGLKWSLMLAALMLPATLLWAQATRREILATVYPGSQVQDERVFLTPEQLQKVAQLSGEEMKTALLARYRIFKDGKEIGRAYVDTHIVRTKKESLLICLNEDGGIRRVEVTAFLEPPDYHASDRWYQQYEGRRLDDDLRLNRAIRPLAGATLTSAAANRAVRRILAVDRVLSGKNGEKSQ